MRAVGTGWNGGAGPRPASTQQAIAARAPAAMSSCRRAPCWQAALAAVAVVLATGAASPPPFVPGDLIVKFTDNSAHGALVTRAVRGEAVAQAQLPELAARLSAELGVPLRAVRVTSGRELVLGIDRERLLAALARRVQRDPAVSRTQPRAEPSTVLPPAEIALVVQCAPGSDAARLLQDAARAGEHRSRAIDALAARLSAGAEAHPAGEASARGELILVLDVAALTTQLLERTRNRADVEYAQLSHVVRPFGDQRDPQRPQQ